MFPNIMITSILTGTHNLTQTDIDWLRIHAPFYSSPFINPDMIRALASSFRTIPLTQEQCSDTLDIIATNIYKDEEAGYCYVVHKYANPESWEREVERALLGESGYATSDIIDLTVTGIFHIDCADGIAQGATTLTQRAIELMYNNNF